jgi:hypothetical protein
MAALQTDCVPRMKALTARSRLAKLASMPPLPPKVIAAASAFVGLVVGFLLGGLRASKAAREAAELKAKLDALDGQPQKWEARIERYDVVWFPIVTAEPKRRAVTGVVAGVPHCKKCVTALSLARNEWSCAKCGHASPESVADVAILDMISKEAVKQYLDRHSGYNTALSGKAS